MLASPRRFILATHGDVSGKHKSDTYEQRALASRALHQVPTRARLIAPRRRTFFEGRDELITNHRKRLSHRPDTIRTEYHQIHQNKPAQELTHLRSIAT